MGWVSQASLGTHPSQHAFPPTGADNNKLRLIFTQLDSSQPSKEFSFAVHIDEGDRYMVEECQPPLDAALVDGLVKQVNANNDFSAFVKGMRRAFKGTVKSN
jgi:hypothetical protein